MVMCLCSAQHRFTLNAVMGRKAPAPEDKSCRANKLVADSDATDRGLQDQRCCTFYLFIFLWEEWMRNNLNNPKTVTEMLSGALSSMCVAVEGGGVAVSSFHRVGWDYGAIRWEEPLATLVYCCCCVRAQTHTHTMYNTCTHIQYMYCIYLPEVCIDSQQEVHFF